DSTCTPAAIDCCFIMSTSSPPRTSSVSSSIYSRHSRSYLRSITASRRDIGANLNLPVYHSVEKTKPDRSEPRSKRRSTILGKRFTTANCSGVIPNLSKALTCTTVHEGRKDFACDKCEKKFTRKPGLLYHQMVVHESRKDLSFKVFKDYLCDKGEKKFEDRKSLKMHQKTIHEVRRTYACDRCEMRYKKRYDLIWHQKTVHEGRKDFVCDNCEKKFGRKSDLLNHQRKVHEGRRDYACDNCDKKFGDKSTLTKHQNIVHEGRKDFACDNCDKKFGEKSTLTKHQNIVHEGRKDFACDNCEKKFAKKSHLFMHIMTVHEGRKDYLCDKCEKKFGNKSYLLRHQRTVHEGRKDYACDICKKTFGQKTHLLFHQRTVHEGRKDHACDKCEKKFGYKSSLLLHQKTVHEGRKDFACDQCEKKFGQKMQLIRHQKTVHEGLFSRIQQPSQWCQRQPLTRLLEDYPAECEKKNGNGAIKHQNSETKCEDVDEDQLDSQTDSGKPGDRRGSSETVSAAKTLERKQSVEGAATPATKTDQPPQPTSQEQQPKQQQPKQQCVQPMSRFQMPNRPQAGECNLLPILMEQLRSVLELSCPSQQQQQQQQSQQSQQPNYPEDSGVDSEEEPRPLGNNSHDSSSSSSDIKQEQRHNCLDLKFLEDVMLVDIETALGRLQDTLRRVDPGTLARYNADLDSSNKLHLLRLISSLLAKLRLPENAQQTAGGAAATGTTIGEQQPPVAAVAQQQTPNTASASSVNVRRRRLEHRHTIGVSADDLARARLCFERPKQQQQANVESVVTVAAEPIATAAATAAATSANPKAAATAVPLPAFTKKCVKDAINESNRNLLQRRSFDATTASETSIVAASRDDANQQQQQQQQNPARPNKFSARKSKIKRANTIDIPSYLKLHQYSAGSGNSHSQRPTAHHRKCYAVSSQPIKIAGHTFKTASEQLSSGGGGGVPSFELKTDNDRKFLALISKNHDTSGASGAVIDTTNPFRNFGFQRQASDMSCDKNWSNRFSSIKTNFDRPTSSGHEKNDQSCIPLSANNSSKNHNKCKHPSGISYIRRKFEEDVNCQGEVATRNSAGSPQYCYQLFNNKAENHQGNFSHAPTSPFQSIGKTSTHPSSKNKSMLQAKLKLFDQGSPTSDKRSSIAIHDNHAYEKSPRIGHSKQIAAEASSNRRIATYDPIHAKPAEHFTSIDNNCYPFCKRPQPLAYHPVPSSTITQQPSRTSCVVADPASKPNLQLVSLSRPEQLDESSKLTMIQQQPQPQQQSPPKEIAVLTINSSDNYDLPRHIIFHPCPYLNDSKVVDKKWTSQPQCGCFSAAPTTTTTTTEAKQQQQQPTATTCCFQPIKSSAHETGQAQTYPMPINKAKDSPIAVDRNNLSYARDVAAVPYQSSPYQQTLQSPSSNFQNLDGSRISVFVPVSKSYFDQQKQALNPTYHNAVVDHQQLPPPSYSNVYAPNHHHHHHQHQTISSPKPQVPHDHHHHHHHQHHHHLTSLPVAQQQVRNYHPQLLHEKSPTTSVSSSERVFNAAPSISQKLYNEFSKYPEERAKPVDISSLAGSHVYQDIRAADIATATTATTTTTTMSPAPYNELAIDKDNSYVPIAASSSIPSSAIIDFDAALIENQDISNEGIVTRHPCATATILTEAEKLPDQDGIAKSTIKQAPRPNYAEMSNPQRDFSDVQRHNLLQQSLIQQMQQQQQQQQQQQKKASPVQQFLQQFESSRQDATASPKRLVPTTSPVMPQPVALKALTKKHKAQECINFFEERQAQSRIHSAATAAAARNNQTSSPVDTSDEYLMSCASRPNRNLVLSKSESWHQLAMAKGAKGLQLPKLTTSAITAQMRPPKPELRPSSKRLSQFDPQATGVMEEKIQRYFQPANKSAAGSPTTTQTSINMSKSSKRNFHAKKSMNSLSKSHTMPHLYDERIFDEDVDIEQAFDNIFMEATRSDKHH
ncbi:unnamed protein product, partial [Trichogramma brassicae]